MYEISTLFIKFVKTICTLIAYNSPITVVCVQNTINGNCFEKKQQKTRHDACKCDILSMIFIIDGLFNIFRFD